MTERQIALVKKSWKILSKINPVLVGDVFYSKLFLDNPQLKSMFQETRSEQAKKLVDMLNTIVTSLDRMEDLKEDIRQLAVRHKEYGVTSSHYSKVADALLWTLERGLGRDFDLEVQQAWMQCYTELADAMQNRTAPSADPNNFT